MTTGARPRRIAVDAMGGDHAPEAPVLAALAVSRSTDIEVLLCGDEASIGEVLGRTGPPGGGLRVIHAPTRIAAEEDPRRALERRDSSLARALQAVATGEAEGLVSAGNTGALVLLAATRLGRLPGVARVALGAVYPTRPRPHNPDPFALIVDAGANLSCRPEHLVEFAALGSAYARVVSRVDRPTVGLLNVGEEPEKGDALLREAHRLLRAEPSLAFAGNVEGRHVPLGAVDVVVCPGILGNVVLKLLESVGELVLGLGEEVFRQRPAWRLGQRLLAGGLRRLSRVMDYRSYGGAPVLGLERVVIKAHGRSSSHALENAIKLAAKAVRDDLIGATSCALAAIRRGQP